MSLFTKCKTCKLCCHNKELGKLIIPLTKDEKKNLKLDKIIVEPFQKCDYLGDDGCVLGRKRPTVCKMFPIIITKDGLGVFEGCPLSKKFKEQMTVHGDPANHYIGCLDMINRLDKKDIKELTKLYNKITWVKAKY